MAPFPETEIMTIKRLEVALRKMDFKLLKDGAYKLHEKYHSGFKFEYLDLLKDLFLDISNNASIPGDIKDILTPTIEDILSSQGIKTDTTTSPYDAMNQDRVSSLTSLSYSTAQQKTEEEPRMNAFSAFGTSNSGVHNQPQKIFTQSPFSAEPFKEINVPQNNYINQSNLQVQNKIEEPKEEFKPSFEPKVEVEQKPQEINETISQISNEDLKPIYEPQIENSHKQNQVEVEEKIAEINNSQQSSYVCENKKELKSVAILYSQDSSLEKIKNIQKYREMISKIKSENVPLNDLMSLITEINTQSNTNVLELRNLLEQLKTKENKVNLITNSISSNLTSLFKENDIKYNMFEMENDSNIELLPLYGLTNLFKCSQCNFEYLNENEMMPIVMQCPKCKEAMLPEIYATSKANSQINMEYYNQAIISFANSKVWLLIHPSLEEKVTLNMLRSALMVSDKVEDIFIVDKDINVRETYKNLFLDIKDNVKINAQISTTEDFFNSIS